MTAAPTIRPAVPADADGIAEVHIRTWRETYAHLLPASYLDGLDVATRAEQWRGTLTSSSGAPPFVALLDDRIVGFALAGPARDEDPPRPFQLYAINVVASAHGTGAGQALFDGPSARPPPTSGQPTTTRARRRSTAATGSCGMAAWSGRRSRERR
ncbi:N-acetyltransferase family protein [Clavibacter zhangzhiyongii]|uniref:GNAT family N-acetyltransferase n=1 Tax=Clavibacter zhangzhiyongii TaxID=2768071 RepID=UPI0039E1CBB1